MKTCRYPVIIFCLLLTLLCIFTSRSPKNESILPELSSKLLRFRVLANSDTTLDQFQKNKVSEEIANELRPLLSNCSSKEEAQTVLEANLQKLTARATDLTAQYGTAYPVTCTLTQHQFPLKMYQNLTFPAGTYDTLLITIGEGNGSNWWCLAYPPLCFAKEAYVTVPEETNTTLENMLSDKSWKAISGQEKTQSDENKEKPKFYFRLLSFLNDFF